VDCVQLLGACLGRLVAADLRLEPEVLHDPIEHGYGGG